METRMSSHRTLTLPSEAAFSHAKAASSHRVYTAEANHIQTIPDEADRSKCQRPSKQAFLHSLPSASACQYFFALFLEASNLLLRAADLAW